MTLKVGKLLSNSIKYDARKRWNITRECLTKVVLSNSYLTVHPDENIFINDTLLRRRFIDEPMKRKTGFQDSEINIENIKHLHADFCEMKNKITSIKLGANGKSDFKLIKKHRESLSKLRSELVLRFLALPVQLEENTPFSEEILEQFQCPPLFDDSPSFKEPEFIPNVGRNAVYYTGNLAEIDFLLKQFISSKFNRKFTRISCPDSLRLPLHLATSPVSLDEVDTAAIEALLINNPHQADEVSSLENTFVLSGCSVQTLLAVFSKQLIKQKYLPKLVYSQGESFFFNQYPQQRSFFTFLVLAHNENQLNEQFTALAKFLAEVLQLLRTPYNCISVSANHLMSSESRRLNYLSTTEETLASCSVHRDYYSRRCEIFATSSSVSDNYRSLHFPVVASGFLDTEAILRVIMKTLSVKHAKDVLSQH